MHSSKKMRLLKIAVSITCVIVMLFSVSGISSYAAVNDSLTYPSSIPLRSGHTYVSSSTTVPVIFDRTMVDDYVQAMNAFELVPGSPFRYRFENDGQVYLSNFVVVEDSTTSWRIVADNGFVSSQTAFRITTSSSTTTIEAVDLEFVCTLDGVLSGDYSVLLTSVVESMSYVGLCPSILYFINLDSSSSGDGTPPTCPTLQEQLASYTGTFGNLVTMLNERNYNEYADASAGIYNDGYDYGYEEGYSDAVGLRGTLQAGQIRLLDEVLDFSAFYDEYPPTEEFTYSDNFNFQVFGGYHADYMIVQYSFGTGYQTLQYSFTDEDSGGLTLISRTTTDPISDTTWIVPRGRLIVIDSMPDDPRFVQFIEDNSSIIDGVQATTLYNYGYGIGYNDGWTNSAIGDAFKAPIDALNNIVLLETAGVTITLGGVILAMISMSIMIVFLKKFAGG